MKMNFDIFQIQKWISEKIGSFVKFPFFPSWVMVPKLPKTVHFLQIYADLSKKINSIKAIYLYPSERPHQALSENSIIYRVLSNSSQDIKEWNIEKSNESAEI